MRTMICLLVLLAGCSGKEPASPPVAQLSLTEFVDSGTHYRGESVEVTGIATKITPTEITLGQTSESEGLLSARLESTEKIRIGHRVTLRGTVRTVGDKPRLPFAVVVRSEYP